MPDGTTSASKQWFQLDNAAKLYPAIATPRWTSMFRLSFVMKEEIDRDRLQQAVTQALQRFPTFKVHLRRGFFWYYLEENNLPFKVLQDDGHPCMPMRFGENNGFLFRVLVYEKRISLEVFHALADGTGGLVFLKSIIAQYLRLGGTPVPYENDIADCSAPPRPEETEDAYRLVPTDSVHASRQEARAYPMGGTLEMQHTLNLISAEIPVDVLRDKARSYGVTITEYLVSVMVFTLWQTQQKGLMAKRMPVKVSVPVNMRKFVKTSTVRNFAFYVNVGIDPKLGHYTFKEAVELIHHSLRYHMNPKFLFAGIATNVASERNILIRICPLPLKNFVLSSVFHRVGDTLVTTTLTNLGAVSLPAAMAQAVERAEMLLGPSVTPRSNCAAISVNNKLVLTFSRNIRETDFERNVLSFLVEDGVPVYVQSNQE